MSNNTILVTGATGKTGRRVAAILRDRGHVVREASRPSEIRFDWGDPATWPAALHEVDAAYIVTPSVGDPASADRFRDFGRLAVESGVTTAVLVSIPDDGGTDFAAVAEAERQLSDAGLHLTILRLRWFNQNFSEDFLAPAVVAGDLRLPAGDGKEAFVDADDIAEVAVAALTDDTHAGRAYEITGPRLLSFADVADELSKATGRPIRYTPLSTERFVSEQLAMGVSEDWAHLSADLYQGIASGGLEIVTDHVEKVLGRPARDFSSYAAAAAATGAWTQ